MQFLFRTLLLFVALLALTIAAIALVLEQRPSVTGIARLTAQDIERAKRIVESRDPRKAGPDGLQTVTIDEQDVGLALSYLANRYGQGAARISLRHATATLRASVELPANPIGRYLNVDASFREAEGVPQVEHMKIGSLPVPGFIAEFLWRASVRQLAQTDRGRFAAGVVKSARFEDGQLAVTYQWPEGAAAQAAWVLVPAADHGRLRAYHERLADVAAGAPQTIGLASLMSPLFRLAYERGSSADPVRENRAAIFVLALYVTGQPMERFVPAAAAWRRPARRSVTLAGRDDFPKHFLVSAAIAAEAGTPLADAIGVYKEVEDSRGGSGFSFNDIGADRAGTRFGEVASRSPARAREVAKALASGAVESDFMPDVSDLPEFMSEAVFEQRYGGVDGAGYRQMMAKINERVNALPLLRR